MIRRNEEARRVWTLSGVPARHKEQIKQGLRDDIKSWNAACRMVLTRIADNGMVGLIGTPGTGKTQIAAVAIRDNAKSVAKPSRYCTAAEMFMDIRDCYRKDSTRSEKNVLDDYCKPDLLAIDEIDKIKASDSEQRLLHLILDRRYRELRKTLLIGNVDAAGLRLAIGDPCFERLIETGCYIELEGFTFRGGSDGTAAH